MPCHTPNQQGSLVGFRTLLVGCCRCCCGVVVPVVAALLFVFVVFPLCLRLLVCCYWFAIFVGFLFGSSVMTKSGICILSYLFWLLSLPFDLG